MTTPSSPAGKAMGGLIVPIDYHQLRMLRCKAVVSDFLRRWGIYLVAGAAIFGAGSNAPFAAVVGLAGVLVLPLIHAADTVMWLLPMTALYAVLGVLPVALTRPLWWPRHWAAAERALPLTDAALRRSDRILALWVMLPWQGLLLLGVVAAGWPPSPVHGANRGWLLLAWAAAALGGLQLSILWMQGARHHAVVRSAPRQAAAGGTARQDAPMLSPTSWRHALMVLPLLRGPARRSAFTLAGGVMLSACCALGTLWPGLAPGWPLAALALVALSATSMLRARVDEELATVWRAAAHLPLRLRDWLRARTALISLPALSGLVLVLPSVARTPGLRWPVLWVYLLVLGAGCVRDAARAESERPSSRAARWLFCLTLAIAIGSEVSSA